MNAMNKIKHLMETSKYFLNDKVYNISSILIKFTLPSYFECIFKVTIFMEQKVICVSSMFPKNSALLKNF